MRYPLFLPDIVKLEFSREIFEKSSNNKYLENPSSSSPVFHADIQTAGGHTDLTELIFCFRNCAKAPKKEMRFWLSHLVLTLYQDGNMSCFGDVAFEWAQDCLTD